MSSAAETAYVLRECMALADRTPGIDRAQLIGTAAVQDMDVILAALDAANKKDQTQ